MIKREKYLTEIYNLIGTPQLKILTGIRRCGKTTLLLQLIGELKKREVKEENIIYLDFEQVGCSYHYEPKELCEDLLDKVNNLSGTIYIIFDEISCLDNWQTLVKSLRDNHNCDIYIASSNASIFDKNFTSDFKNSYAQIKVKTLNFKEYLELAKENQSEADFTNDEHYKNFIKFGGMPFLHHIQWSESANLNYLESLYCTILSKDILDISKIRNVNLLNRIFCFILQNQDRTYNAKTIADEMRAKGIKLGTQTVYNYLEALTNAYLIHKDSELDLKFADEHKTKGKYYITDRGLRYALIGDRDPVLTETSLNSQPDENNL